VWAKKGGGEVFKLDRGMGRGLRMADYITSSFDAEERQWLIWEVLPR
jgi:hypothetical protein